MSPDCSSREPSSMAIHSRLRFLGIEGRADALREILCRTLTPEVREGERRLLADHVIVQGDDVYAGLSEGTQHGLPFRPGHDEIAIDDRVLLPARERGPRRQAHRPADL